MSSLLERMIGFHVNVNLNIGQAVEGMLVEVDKTGLLIRTNPETTESNEKVTVFIPHRIADLTFVREKTNEHKNHTMNHEILFKG